MSKLNLFTGDCKDYLYPRGASMIVAARNIEFLLNVFRELFFKESHLKKSIFGGTPVSKVMEQVNGISMKCLRMAESASYPDLVASPSRIKYEDAVADASGFESAYSAMNWVQKAQVNSRPKDSVVRSAEAVYEACVRTDWCIGEIEKNNSSEMRFLISSIAVAKRESENYSITEEFVKYSQRNFTQIKSLCERYRWSSNEPIDLSLVKPLSLGVEGSFSSNSIL